MVTITITIIIVIIIFIIIIIINSNILLDEQENNSTERYKKNSIKPTKMIVHLTQQLWHILIHFILFIFYWCHVPDRDLS